MRTGEYGSGIYRSVINVYDRVPREMTKVNVELAKVRMVEGTYEETNGRVVCGSGISEKFVVNVGLRQRSDLRPLLVIAVVEVISRKTSTKDTSCCTQMTWG